jgi:hypothetical protein
VGAVAESFCRSRGTGEPCHSPEGTLAFAPGKLVGGDVFFAKLVFLQYFWMPRFDGKIVYISWLLGFVLFCEQFQMEEAVAIEDFQEAARLKGALDAVTATDTVAEVMVELKVCSCPQLSCLGTMCREFKSEPYLGA